MHDNLEFHYVISCKGGVWSIVEEDPYFPDGTIYDWDNEQWTFASEEDEDGLVEDLDLAQYHDLQSALREMNGA